MLMRIKARAKSMDQIRRSGETVVFSCDGKLFFGFDVRVKPDVKPLKVYGMQKNRRFGLQSQFYPKKFRFTAQ